MVAVIPILIILVLVVLLVVRRSSFSLRHNIQFWLIGGYILLLLASPVLIKLHARPFILPEDQEIRVIMRTDTSEVMLTIDGQIGFPLLKNDSVVIRKADYYTKLVKVKKRSFSEVLNQKLRGEH
jgi:hypothetical protein